MSKRDYYEILGVDKQSSKDEIKKSYRKLAMKYHPDRNPDNKDAESKFKEASEAAEVLLSEEKKSRYDQFGHAGVNGQAGGGFGGGGFSGDFGDLGDIFGDIFGSNDMFGDMFGGGGRRRSKSRAQRGADLQMQLEINFKEAALGIEKSISVARNISCDACDGSGGENGAKPTQCSYCNGQGEVRRQQGFFTVSSACHKCQGTGQVISVPCKKCHGHGVVKKKRDLEVKIPAGIDSGQRLKLSNEGDSGRFNGPAGDLYVIIKIAPHDFLERDGFDVYCSVPITFSQAALGAEIEVPTLDGKVEVKIPAGIQSGSKMRLKAKGIKRLGSYGQGDQILEIHVETPTSLNTEQKDLFKKLSEFNNENFYPLGKSFLNKVKGFFS